MSNKRFGKGQISMFVILGLVLVIVISMMAYVLSHTISKKPPRTVSSVLGYRYEAFRNFVESCLELELDKELRTIALNGGYLNPEDKGFFTLPEMPTESNAVSFFGKTIPYWFYMDSPNNCQHCSFKTQIPLLEGPNSIEEELESVVAKNIVKCFNNFSQFKEKGVLVTMLGKPSVDVSFTSKAVQAKLDLNLKVVVDKNEATCFGTFSKTLNIPFKSLYRIGKALTQYEMRNALVESFTFQRVVLPYTLGKNPKLPPLALTKVAMLPKPRIWLTSEVSSFLQAILPSAVSLFKVESAKNYFIPVPNSTVELAQVMAATFSINDFLNPEELDVLQSSAFVFSYLGWPLYLKIKPGVGEVVMSVIKAPPIPSLGFIPLPSIVEENFLYDLSFPVLVTLKYEAPNVKPFIFRFAWEANIRNNKPLSVFENATITSEERELNFCDPATFSADVTVTTVDENGDALPGVDIGFECAGVSCFLGTTRVDEADNNKAVLRAKLPSCIHGILFATKQDYSKEYVVIPVVNSDDKVEKTFTLYKGKTVNITVRKRLIKKELDENNQEVWTFKPDTNEVLQPGEQAIIFFERLNPYTKAVVSTTFAKINASRAVSSLQSSISLKPGLYKLQAIVLLKFSNESYVDKVEIPPREMCYPDDWYDQFGFGKEKCFTLNGTVFNESFLVGQLIINESEPLTITPQDLYDHDKLTVYVPAVNVVDINTYEDLGVIGNFSTFKNQYPDKFTLSWS